MELLKVLIDGQQIDLDRVIRTPGSEFDFEVLEEEFGRQRELFSEEVWDED